VCITAPEEMLLGKAMISGQWRCCAVKNKYMKRIKNQFRTDQLQSTESALYGNLYNWRIRTRFNLLLVKGHNLSMFSNM